MKNIILKITIAFIVIIRFSNPVQSQMVTQNDALTIANNWIEVIIQSKGSWGSSERAEVSNIEELKREERVLGYICQIEPVGYIVISLRKELFLFFQNLAFFLSQDQ